MRINGVSGAFGPNVVDQIMEVQRAPIEQAKGRRERVVEEKNEYASLGNMLGELGKSLQGLSTPSSFQKLMVESSHPDIIDGKITGPAAVGSYEMVVNGLAKADKMLAAGFPDVDKTAVGFGYLGIEREDLGTFDLTIEPGSTLKDVVEKINGAGAGVKASIVNTGMADDPFRLMVTSEATGEASRIILDADTTLMEFNNQVTGRDLDVSFEDVGIKRATNELGDLLSGIQLKAKKADPGTAVQINVTHDVDSTMGGIKAFTEKYNQIIGAVQQQYQKDPQTGRLGPLAGDVSVRSTVRSLQTQVSTAGDITKKHGTLASIGITTNAKTGELQVDDEKLKTAIAEDYDGVTALFAKTEHGDGVAERLSKTVKALQDRETGPLASRQRGLEAIIRNQDKDIERQTQRLEDKERNLQRTFANLDAKMATMQSQQQFLTAKFGGEGGGGQAPAAPSFSSGSSAGSGASAAAPQGQKNAA